MLHAQIPGVEPIPVQSRNVPEERFNSVLEYTYRNFDRPISLDAISKVAHLTKESFCRYFKSKARKTYIAFLTEYRIRKACSMIGNNNKTIKEIGYTCGFDSLSNFYHQFKKITDLSPLEYRQLQENSFSPANKKFATNSHHCSGTEILLPEQFSPFPALPYAL